MSEEPLYDLHRTYPDFISPISELRATLAVHGITELSGPKARIFPGSYVFRTDKTIPSECCFDK